MIIAGGGTGGHVFPALALASQLEQDHPGAEVLLVGSVGGLEQRLVPASGHRLELLRVGKLRGTGLLNRARTMAGLPLAVASAAGLLRRFKPDVVVGVGGYASAPVVLAAAPLGLPVVLLEQNSVPGGTNRALAQMARRVVLSFGQTIRHFPAHKTALLGNPVRPELLQALQAADAQPAADARGPCLLVLGGSQGARAVNQLVADAAPALFELVPGLRLVHQTGGADHPEVAGRYQRAGLAAEAVPFIDDMTAAYLAADLVLGRSGATTVAELGVTGLPAVLVPYPFAVDDHQALNTEDLVAAGGALMRRQEQLTASGLAGLLGELLADPQRLRRMGAAARGCGFPDAAKHVAALVASMAND